MDIRRPYNSLPSQCDKLALHLGKRCVLWDDDGAGFTLWLRWDWARNQPARIPADDPQRCGGAAKRQRHRQPTTCN